MKYNNRLKKLEPYFVSSGAALKSSEKSKWLKLDWNESTIPPSPHVREALLSFILNEDLRHYPDVNAHELKSKLSQYVEIEENHIEVYNGSDDAFNNVFHCLINPQDTVVIYEPTYTQVKVFIQSRTDNLKSIPIVDPLGDHKYSFEEIEKASVVYLANPNNPTGYLIKNNEIEALLKTHKETTFIVDEAYYEFCQHTAAHLVRQYKNLIVTRTFSKAFGLAGSRIGYVVAHPEVLSILNKVRNGKSVNVMGQVAASAALDDTPYMEKYVSEVNKSKSYFINEATRLGLECYTGFANFVIIREPNCNNLIEHLRNCKILIRDRSYLKNLEDCVRITIGTHEQTCNLIDALEAYCE